MTSPRRLPISDDDVQAVVRLLGRIAGQVDSLPDRRRALMLGLAGLVGADVWVWIHSGGWASGRPIGLALLDGGWLDDAERNRMYHANVREDVTASLSAAIDPIRPSTFVYDRTHPGFGDGTLYEQVIRPIGLEHLLFSMHPLPGGCFSGIGLHRRADKPPYTPRDVAVAHLVLGQVDWLHRLEAPAVVNEAGLAHLTPREREVLVHLLGGTSRKGIAIKMNLSEHTIADHCKALYKRLSVSSRAELMAKFLPAT